MRYAFVAVLILCALGAQAIPQDGRAPAKSRPQNTAARKIPCKIDENASMCYWTHGRITFYLGDPSYRVWKVGTKRILGIHSGPAITRRSADAYIRDGGNPEFPPNLDKVYDSEYKHRVSAGVPDASLPDPVYADFEVCPLGPEHPGWMQEVCVESAKHIVVERWVRNQSTTVTYPDTY